MIRAYNEIYLNDAMRNLGEAFDYAANVCNIGMDTFMRMFLTSGPADQFEAGNPKYVSGMSGREIVMEVLYRAGTPLESYEVQIEYAYSKEYWCGWILAYYQWYTGRRLKDIYNLVNMKEIENLYAPLHEAPEDKFVEAMNQMIKKKNSLTKLQTYRKIMKYSQKELADKSGVKLRMIQQYEQRAKNINNASATTLLALSRTLGCEMEDLMEFMPV